MASSLETFWNPDLRKDLDTSRVPHGDEDDFKTAKSVFSHGTFYTASVGGIDMQSTAGRLPEYAS
jgi:hypothetical protein